MSDRLFSAGTIDLSDSVKNTKTIHMTKSNEDRDFSAPPFFKSWKSIYYIVIGNLIMMILLFYLFTTSFQ